MTLRLAQAAVLAALLTLLNLPSAQAADPPGELPAPELTEDWTPVRTITPGATPCAAPSDAIVLFNGQDLNAWQSATGGPPPWKLDRGELLLVPTTGNLRTKAVFGDAQIHVEFRFPEVPMHITGQARSNSGLFIQGLYEVQILDSHGSNTYSNGQLGAVYKQHAPLVNPARPPLQWQSYDIVFTAPRFGAAGQLLSPARMTVLLNGVLVQHNVELKGPTVYRGQPAYAAHGPGPLVLQDHGNEGIRFRNIWVRPLGQR